MPYSGPGDDKLPTHVKEMPASAREAWVKAFNRMHDDCMADGGGDDCEGKAMRGANAMAKRAMMTIQVGLTEYVTVRPGGLIRLLPFGRIVKGGKSREITPEVARAFRLPHFRPPVKLGSHEETTPAGGHIIGLEVLPDGLYGRLEMTDKGQRVIDEGDYRYHSPEIIWEEGYLENPETGEEMRGPLIVGDALLHTPHLGEATALYVSEPLGAIKGAEMAEEMMNVPAPLGKKIMDKFSAWLDGLDKPLPAAPQPVQTPIQAAPEPPQVQRAEEYTALKAKADEADKFKAQADEYAAKLQKLEAEKERAGRVTHFATQLHGTSLAGDSELHGLLADLPKDKAEALATKLKGLSAQVRVSNLTTDLGTAANPVAGNSGAELNALVTAKMVEAKVEYNAALDMVRRERPDVFAAYQKSVYGGK